MKAGKLASVGGMELSSGEVIPELESDKGYKYLGILEANNIMFTEMKDSAKNLLNLMIDQGESKHMLLKQIKKSFNRHPEAFQKFHSVASDIPSRIDAT